MPQPADQSWILTYTGKHFYPLSPRIDEIDILDIAHGLSNICRFTGACREFYSVAQHSVHASFAVPPPLELAALLHDASEAYLCDVSRPVKYAESMAAYRHAEQHLMTCIGYRFGIPTFDIPSIHEIDNRLLATERRDLMNCGEELDDWQLRVQPLPLRIVGWAPPKAEAYFLSRFEHLFPYIHMS